MELGAKREKIVKHQDLKNDIAETYSLQPVDIIPVFLFPLYSGSELWEGIWNQTHLVVLNFCLDRLYHDTIFHDNARSNRWCQ